MVLDMFHSGAAAPVQTGELIDKQEASPKKRRKKAPGAGEVEEGAPAAKRVKKVDAPAAGELVCMQSHRPQSKSQARA